MDDSPGVAEENKYSGGMYFPSGAPSREERRQEDDWTDINGSLDNGQGQAGLTGGRDDGWTDLNGERNNNNAPEAREEERPITQRDIDREQTTESEQITEGNFLIPVRTPGPRTPSPPSYQEDERTRRPWLPNMDTEIKSFDDLFSNHIDDSLAQGRTSGSSINFLNSFMAVISIITAIICKHFER